MAYEVWVEDYRVMRVDSEKELDAHVKSQLTALTDQDTLGFDELKSIYRLEEASIETFIENAVYSTDYDVYRYVADGVSDPSRPRAPVWFSLQQGVWMMREEVPEDQLIMIWKDV